MVKKIIFLFCLFTNILASAQIGGEATYRFLNLITSPRQAALGGKVLTNVDYDVTQGLYNPATINAKMNNQLALNYTSYLGGISYGAAAYAYTFDRRTQTFHAGVTYIDYGKFDGFNESDQETGSFTGKETALSVGYALKLGHSNFYLGSNIKLITSKLEQYSSFGAAVDLGLLYMDEVNDFNAALVVRNIGTQITVYDEQNEPLPLEVDFGLSQTLENVPIRWHITFENLQKWPIATPNPARATSDLNGNQSEEKVGFFGQFMRHTIVGAELFPEGGFNIRFAYNFRRGEELRIIDQRNFSGLSAGFTIKFNKMRFSYAHAKYASAANANFFGLQIDLQ